MHEGTLYPVKQTDQHDERGLLPVCNNTWATQGKDKPQQVTLLDGQAISKLCKRKATRSRLISVKPFQLIRPVGNKVCRLDLDKHTHHAGMNAQSSPEEKQASFKQTYTILIAFLNATLPPVITTSTDDATSTNHEVALGKHICPGCHLTLYRKQLCCSFQGWAVAVCMVYGSWCWDCGCIASAHGMCCIDAWY